MGPVMAWLILYRHRLRTDETGVKVLADKSDLPAEKRTLKRHGYVIVRVEQRSYSEWTALSKDEDTLACEKIA
jgi:hypothetical protein